MKFLRVQILIVTLLFITVKSFAQPKSFSTNPDKFLGEMESYFKDTKADDDTRTALNTFQKLFQGQIYSIDQKNMIMATANKMADRKMKADQEYQDYLNTLIDIQKSSRAAENFDVVHSILEASFKK